MKRLLLGALLCIPVADCNCQRKSEWHRRDPEARMGGWNVIYVPTEVEVVDKMLELAKITKDDVVYDLGCGDGRIVCIAAKKYGAKSIGIDINPERIAETKETMKKYGVTEDQVEFRLGDAIDVDDLPRATVITLFMMPEFMEEFEKQIFRLKPGTRIVAHDYAFPNLRPDKTLDVEALYQHHLYLWNVGERPMPHCAADGVKGGSIWTLDLKAQRLKTIKVSIPGRPERSFWYLRYTTENNTKEPHKFVPESWLSPDHGKTLVMNDVLRSAEAKILLLEDPNRKGNIKNSPRDIEPGKKTEGIAVWEGVDPAAATLTVNFRGLTNAHKVENGKTLCKMLKLQFQRPGDKNALNERRLRGDVEWEYREAPN